MNREIKRVNIMLVVGGSIPAGKGVCQGYVEILGRKLKDKGMVFVNRAVKETTSFDGVSSLTGLLKTVRPLKVLIHYGIDDIYHPVYRSEFKENLVQMCRKAGEMRVRAVLSTSHPFVEQEQNQVAELYYRTIREVAVELNCDYIPVHLIWVSELLTNTVEHGSLVQRDSRLPNRRGHRFLAKIMEYHLMKN